MSEVRRCPGCGDEMAPGVLRIKGTISGFLLVGRSWQYLWWSGPEESRASREKLMASGERVAADRCGSCGMVAFLPPGGSG